MTEPERKTDVANGKQGFTIFHADINALSSVLTAEQMGRLFVALSRYSERGEAEVADDLKGVFALLVPKIDQQNAKYAETCARNRTNRTSRDQSSPVVTSGDQSSRAVSSRPQQEQELKQEQEHNRILTDADGGEAANAHTRARETHDRPDTDDGSIATGTENVQVAAQKPKVKAIRHKYGEYQNVLLTDEDYAKLRAEFPTEYEALIERLSAYMASTGRAYKNHLATMRNWARRDLEKGVARSSPIPQAREAPPVYRQQTKAEELDDFYHMAAEWAAEASGGNDV